MPRKKKFNPRPVWEDRFAQPTADELVGGAAPEGRALIQTARRHLDEFDEQVEWLGIPWRWSFVYRTQEGRPWAYLIPNPDAPMLALPIPVEALQELSHKRLARFVRDGIIQASEVGPTRWAEWTLTSETQINDLIRLGQSAVLRPTA